MENRVELIWGTLAKMKHGQEVKEHQHPCFQLYYILSGSPTYVVADVEFTANPGEYFVVPEATPHSMLPLNNGDLVCYELKFLIYDTALAAEFQSLRAPLKDSSIVPSLLRYIVKSWSLKSPENITDIDYILTTILMSFCVEDRTFTNRDSRFVITDNYNSTTKRALLYIENNYPDQFSSEQMALALNYHYNYLASTFKKNTGVTIVDYLNMIRIRNAVIIFVYYGQDVSSTADCVGFRDISYFSRTFKNLTGTSPRQFKKALGLSRNKKEEKMSLIDPILNFQVCTMEESFQALRNIKQYCE